MTTTTTSCSRRWSTRGGSDLHITTNRATAGPRGREARCGCSSAADRRRETKQAGLQRAHRRAEEALRGRPGARLLVRHQGARALPLQRLQPARRRRRVYRAHPEKIRAFEDLGLPPVLATLAERPRGLVLVTGPTGSGKSTTLAAMLDKINAERHEHILTIEDPIEYIHQHKSCLVNQREVHSDTDSFPSALRARCARTRTSC